MTTSMGRHRMASTLAPAVRAWVLENRAAVAPARPASDARWRAVRESGTELWLDTGDVDGIQALWTSEFGALTTNNTLLNNEVQRGQYDDLVRRTAAKLRSLSPDIAVSDLVLEIAFVLNAVHGLRLVDTFGAFVSVEEHTDLAQDVDLAVLYGERFHALCPERFFVKLPLTPAGLLGMRRLGRLGIPVNFTLGFSARQNFLAARLGDPTYVNVFLGRLNAFVADRKLGSGEGVGEKATAASQEAIAALRRTGGATTRQIAASMRSGEQVWSLAGVDVMTIPPAAAKEYHESTRPPVTGRGPRAADLEPAVDARALRTLGFDRLWDVPADFRSAVDRILHEDLDVMTPGGLVDLLRRHGAGDVFPDWSPEDLEAIRTDGKIPTVERWAVRLESRSIGLDALFNRSGLESFAQDQKALDDRVRGLVG